MELPLVGKVTAGEPILAVENIEDTFPCPLIISNNGENPSYLLFRKQYDQCWYIGWDYTYRQQSTA